MAEVEPHTQGCEFDSDGDDDGEEDLSPFQIYWLDVGGPECTRRIGISGLPGCRFKDTWRNLDNDIKCLQSEGIDEIFSLCSKGELNKYRVPWLLNEMSGADLTVHHYPFPDGQIPSMDTLLKMVDEIHKALENNRVPLVHTLNAVTMDTHLHIPGYIAQHPQHGLAYALDNCYGGLGRSCLVAVCALLVRDETVRPEDAIKQVRELRGPAAIQSVKQYNFVCDFRELYSDYLKDNDIDFRSISR